MCGRFTGWGDEEVVALKRINLEIYKGEICCIFGTSGSGKSTLLNQLAGMEKPTEGQVFIRGKNIPDMNGPGDPGQGEHRNRP